MRYGKIYFIGIGGIGMSAIARFCKFKGLEVSGYDRTPSPLTAALEAEGIAVHYVDDPSRLPSDVGDTLVVYTPAVPDSFGELAYAREKGYRVIKRSRMLGELCEGETCLAVAGTHGKTTTSTLVAHILTESGHGCSAFLGGISKNYGTNHLDIYGDLEHVRDAFREFASQVSETLILKHGLPISSSVTGARIYSYHYDNALADFHGSNFRLDAKGCYTYDLVYPGGVLRDIRVGTIGWVNVENSIAAAAICLCYGIDGQKVRHAIGSFQGAVRRLDVHVNREGVCYIDDYAHHPAELRSAISSVREVFPGRRITGIFQPHLYTRTRDFAPEFAEALSLLDKLILLDIYPAREEPIQGVSSELIFKDVRCPEKILLHKEELMDYLAKERIDVLITLGAGDIDRFINPISELLSR